MATKQLNALAFRCSAALATIAALCVLAGCAGQRAAPDEQFTISMLGTNDVHGQLLPAGDRGGLIAISAYANALREAREDDGGAVLIIDAGDMWQGTLDSNLVEGRVIVEAFNAIGYDAAALGNHEFDFGPVGPKAVPEDSQEDPRGALKRGAMNAKFPLLAANLIDEQTGEPVAWDNVTPSAVLTVNGVKIGVIGVMTSRALLATIAANTVGLRVAPLAETIIKEATVLRNKGASIVVVAAHAGASCRQFDDPRDVTSCNMSGEIMQVANAIPRGLVDHIFAGHAHQGIAHIVNGISITSAYSNTRAFSRVDLVFDPVKGRVVSRKVHPPHRACLSLLSSTGACAMPSADPAQVVSANYEGRALHPSPAVVAIAERAAASVAQLKQEKLGIVLESTFGHPPATESPLANLMTHAMRESTGADIAIETVVGSIRNTLPAGELTFGAVYEMFPFDNRSLILELTGRQLRRVIAGQAHRARRRVGFSGMRVFIRCAGDRLNVLMLRQDGRPILDEEVLSVAVNDYLALGGDGVLEPVIPEDGFDVDYSRPLARDMLVDWFRRQGGSLNPDDFETTANPKWNVPEMLPPSCSL